MRLGRGTAVSAAMRTWVVTAPQACVGERNDVGSVREDRKSGQFASDNFQRGRAGVVNKDRSVLIIRGKWSLLKGS
jgi:hypothetical protein